MTACYLGVDIGSLTVKAALVDGDQHLLANGVAAAGYGGQEAAETLIGRLMDEAGVGDKDLAYTVATGYGRVRSTFADEEISEVSCHAKGAFYHLPGARTIIDVGGQDSKAIRLDSRGQVVDFAMNDKCAAGTGRFLEVMAAALEVPVAGLGALAAQAGKPVRVSSTCTVFAESEAISHIARGAHRADVAAGLHEAIASRIMGLVHRVGLEPLLVMTGGVALNTAVVAAMGKLAGMPIHVAPNPQLMGALGAALFAGERRKKRTLVNCI